MTVLRSPRSRRARRALIRAIVFDIGWVFVKLKRQALLDCLVEHGCDTLDFDTLVARIKLDDHETGRMSGFGLIERITALATKPVAPGLLHTKWLDIFELEPRMVDLAHRLSDRYREKSS